MTNLRARLAGDDIGQPGRVGARRQRGDDLDAIAVLQFGAQGHRLEVDAAGNAAVADVGMHRIGEIDRRRPAR